ncbi:MAG: glycosyltransferase family 4 protein [Bacteroidota bacterium]|nr:glycosyltransferase family 4 protein [Bacteroidota bacterium]
MPSKKKIILIGSVPPPHHGSNIYFNNLLNSKVKEEFDVSHLDISDHRNLDNLSKLDFTNVRIAIKNIILLFKMLRRINPDLVYIPVSSNFLPYLRDGLFIFTASYFSKAKIVIHLHEGNYFREEFFDNSNFIVKLFIKKSLSKVNAAVVYSERLKSVFDGLVKEIYAFPNGINDTYDNSYKEKSIKAKNNINISFLGNLFESKGVLDVLNAAVIITKQFNKIEFNFAGAWSENEAQTKINADDIIKQNNLGKFVKFCGVLTGEQKENFLYQTDILLFPTWYKFEGCPLVIIEAMSFGIPVISTKDIGTIHKMVINGETGILVSIKNPAEIAAAIIKLIEDSSLRSCMGKAGRKRFEKMFTMKRNVENIIGVFNKTLNHYLAQ